MTEVASPTWLDDDQQRAWRGWLDVHAQLTARLGRQLQATTGLSMADYAVLVELTSPCADDGEMRMFELGDRLQWEKSRLSKHVTRMEQRGLLTRRHCADDRRGANVAITDAGRSAIAAAAPAHVALVRELFFADTDPADVRRLAEFTEQVLGRLGVAALGGDSPVER